MTSTWRERPSHDAANPEGDGSDLLSRDTAEGFSSDQAEPETARDFIDRGMSDAQDLHRLEESIRWLVNAGTGSGPTTPLPRIVGLENDDDALLINPETLFARPRGRNTLGSVVRVVLVSAIAAPTAYFIANWLQTPGSPTSADPVVVTAPIVLPDDDRAGAGPAVTGDTSAMAPVNIARAAPDETATATDSTVAAPTVVTPEPAAPPPLPAPVVVASPSAAIPPPAVPAAAIPSAAIPPAAVPPAAVAPAQTTAVPAKPQMPPQDAAKFVAKGNELFDAGDLSAARLFFRRAAEAGDPTAAIAMGSTYDPQVLARRRIRNTGNAEEAQRWYSLAQEMGRRSTELALGH